MKTVIKIMESDDTVQQVLNRVEFFQVIKESEGMKSFLGLKNEYNAYDKLEIIGYRIAAKKVKTVEDIKLCVKWILKKYNGNHDENLLAKAFRVKAYKTLKQL